MQENAALKKENKNLKAGYQKIRTEMAEQVESHELEIQKWDSTLKRTLETRDYFMQKNTSLIAEFQTRTEFLKQPQIAPKYLAYQAAKKAKLGEQSPPSEPQIAAPKSQAHEPQKRSSGFER